VDKNYIMIKMAIGFGKKTNKLKFKIKHVVFDTRSITNATLEENLVKQASLAKKWTGYTISINDAKCSTRKGDGIPMEALIFNWFEEKTGWLFHQATVVPLFCTNLLESTTYTESWNYGEMESLLIMDFGDSAKGFSRLQTLIIDPLG